MNSYKLEIWIGDYSVSIWINPNEDKNEQIKQAINHGISQYGLKVVNA